MPFPDSGSEGSVSVQIQVPPGWRHLTNPVAEVLFTMAAPRPAASGHVPAVSVLVPEQTDLRLPEALTQVAADLADAVERPDLEDFDIHDFAGHDVGYLRLAHQHAGQELICEAWCWVVEGVLWVVIASVGCSDYADYVDLVEEIALSFTPPEVPLAG